METEVMRGGESVLWMKIAQKKDAVHLHLRTHPIVEDFFRELSGGKEATIASRGEGVWFGVENKDLRIYQLPNSNEMSYGGLGYQMNAEGFRLSPGTDAANLSFLRIKGISKPEGVVLGVYGVMSFSARRQFKDSVKTGISRFVRDYLIPVTIELDIRVDERVDNSSRIQLS